ncbi:MAG: hypothetical protein K0Q79_2289 [Flavipsychrobacter sp.]|jgi:hypothetical protein|nr:hypothetical protein [Flavipsychrobacter sp.]
MKAIILILLTLLFVQNAFTQYDNRLPAQKIKGRIKSVKEYVVIFNRYAMLPFSAMGFNVTNPVFRVISVIFKSVILAITPKPLKSAPILQTKNHDGTETVPSRYRNGTVMVFKFGTNNSINELYSTPKKLGQVL